MNQNSRLDKQGNNRASIGRGEPPKYTRWRPGQSGNPNGRPRKEACLTTLLKEELERTVTDQNLLRAIGAKMGDVTWAQAIAMALIRKAAKGNERSAEIIFDRTEGRVRQPVCEPAETQSVRYDYSRLTDQELCLLQSLIEKIKPLTPEDFRSVDINTTGGSHDPS